MKGLVDDDMFTIDLSDEEDSTINSPLKDQPNIKYEKLSN